MHGIAMVLAMVVMGVIFLISQVLILREFLMVFQGNEFSIGIVLGSWLLLEALGSWLSGRRADRSRDPLAAFATVQVMLSLLLPLPDYIFNEFVYGQATQKPGKDRRSPK